jgi:AraC-like DNA-binding protein
LLNTRSSIEAIRTELGFHSQFAFARAFKRRTGYSPRQYRNLHADAKN